VLDRTAESERVETSASKEAPADAHVENQIETESLDEAQPHRRGFARFGGWAHEAFQFFVTQS
jgi:hypothetical protein